LDNFKIIIKPIDISKLYNLFSGLFLNKNLNQLADKSEFNHSFDARILLAEDNEVNQILIKEYLNRFNLEPVIANNGAEAIEFLKEDEFDLVLMDINMPEMDGIEAIKIIKGKMNFKKPVIALTAHALVGDQKKLLNLGFDGYLPKPVSIENLLNILRKYLTLTDLENVNVEESEERDNLSYDYLSKKLGIPDKLLNKLLDKFFVKTKELLNELDEKVSNKSYNDIYRIAHNLKGMSGNMHFTFMSKLCEHLEFEARNKNDEKIDSVFEKIKQEFEQIKSELGDELK
jgi:CheY-like chemotaxis protein